MKQPEAQVYEYNGRTHTLVEWAEITGIKYDALYYRINRAGWPIDKALSTPLWNEMPYKHPPEVKRHLDAAYFEIMRDGQPTVVCFTDMSKSERHALLRTLRLHEARNLAYLLGETLRHIGDKLDVVCVAPPGVDEY